MGQLGLIFSDPPAPQRRVWRVGQLVGEVRNRVERAFADVWVEGEVSNCRPAASGHVYFTLKDGEAQLPVVLFRRQALLLRFRLEDGLQVVVRGRVSVYEQRGQMQLIAEWVEPVGAGSLQVAFEQLKAKLQEEGLFQQERKKPLPAFPHCIGIITSPAGAVIRDFINIAGRRHLGLNVQIYPAAVQGAPAAMEVAAGIAWFNQDRSVDVIVLARGGGSLEDLAPFNSELLARAIANSALPVVSAIGHETDFTIADFVADMRAPTPSAAAELLTEAQHKVEERLEQLHRRLLHGCRYQLMRAQERFSRLSAPAAFARMRHAWQRRQQRVDELQFQMDAAWRRRSRQMAETLQRLDTRMLRQDVSLHLRTVRERLAALEARIGRAQRERLLRTGARHANAEARLQILSPLAVLNRGYALVFDEGGSLVRESAAAPEGSVITVRFADSDLTSRVLERNPPPTTPMKKLFGTDGIRGVAGEAPLDCTTIYAIGLALAARLTQSGLAPRVLLGADTRESSPWIAAEVAAGLRSGGANVLNAGVITTPGVAYLTRKHGFSAGVVISASHNPWQDNGIKVFAGDGYKLPDAVELEIEAEIFRRLEGLIVPPSVHPRELPIDSTFRQEYEAYLQGVVPGLNLTGKRIVIDCANGAAAVIASELFPTFGGDVRFTHVSPDGRNINEGCGALHPEVVARETRDSGAEMGITFDGDADRALFADATGKVVNGDGVLLVAARDMQARGELAGDMVVATTMSNMGLEAALRSSGIHMLRAPVGDKYVLEMMQANQASLGGEQSGHILFPARSTTGDGLLTALLLLDTVSRAGKQLAALVSDLRVFPQVIVNVRVREKTPLEQLPSVVESIQHAETDLHGNGRVVVRYSGTEALARVMIEAESELQMRKHADLIAQAIRTEIGV